MYYIVKVWNRFLFGDVKKSPQNTRNFIKNRFTSSGSNLLKRKGDKIDYFGLKDWDQIDVTNVVNCRKMRKQC